MRTSIRVILITASLLAFGGARADGAGGRVLWRFQIPSDVSGRFVGVGADGRVYTTSFDPPDLYALSPGGSLIWSLRVGPASGHWPITFAADGTIYTGALGVRAVNPDGTLRWAFDPPDGDWISAGPTVGPDGNIYAADCAVDRGLGFFSLDPEGNLRWSNPGDPPPSAIIDGLDEVVFGPSRCFAGIHFLRSGPWITSYAFDLGGQQVWFGGNGDRALGATSNPRMLSDGRLVFSRGPQGELMAVQQGGTVDWIIPHPDGAQQLLQPTVGTDGSIYSGDAYGVQLWSANPDGTTRWVRSGKVDEHLDSLGVSPNNQVLVAGGWTWFQSDGLNHGWVRGYDPASGNMLWQLDLELEQNLTQITRTVRPAFSANGDTAYLTTWFVGNGVGHTYLYAIDLIDGGASGDMNCDGTVNGFDVDGFVLALSDPAEYAAAYPECDIANGDVNADGSVNGFDVDGFVDLLGG